MPNSVEGRCSISFIRLDAAVAVTRNDAGDETGLQHECGEARVANKSK